MESLNGVNAITIVFAALCIFAIAYRFYGLWVAQKVLNINAARETPANRFEDGKDYVPTNKYVLFGHHFAAIAAAGPLLGPVLAAQFGYLPGLLWILIGCVLAGGVHDMVVLFCSVRHRGKSLAYIASQEIDTTTGRVAAWAVLAILLLTLAGLSIAVVNAMHNSLWSTYTVFCTIPIAVLMGLYMQVWRKGDVRGATIMGVVLLFLCILSGPWVASHPEYFGWLDIDKPEMSLFITIACGALSGFHATIGTGTTPKMINNEKDVLFVGYGAMLMEGFVAVMALVAACVLVPADYFAINAPAEKFAKLGMDVVELPTLEAEVQENLMHRPGGSVSLAVGMAHIFSKIPAMESLMAYWYHFAIMFEAVFILTAVDAGTRVGRFFLQEMVGKVWPRFADKDWWPGIIITSAVFTGAWGYLVYSGDIGSIWPLFGICNQLLASVTLLIGTTVIIRMNHVKYAWTTGAPGILMTFITFWAGIWLIINQYLPSGQYLLAFLSALVMCLMLFVIVGVLRRWMVLLNIHTTVKDKYGVEVKTIVEE